MVAFAGIAVVTRAGREHDTLAQSPFALCVDRSDSERQIDGGSILRCAPLVARVLRARPARADGESPARAEVAHILSLGADPRGDGVIRPEGARRFPSRGAAWKIAVVMKAVEVRAQRDLTRRREAMRKLNACQRAAVSRPRVASERTFPWSGRHAFGPRRLQRDRMQFAERERREHAAVVVEVVAAHDAVIQAGPVEFAEIEIAAVVLLPRHRDARGELAGAESRAAAGESCSASSRGQRQLGMLLRVLRDQIDHAEHRAGTVHDRARAAHELDARENRQVERERAADADAAGDDLLHRMTVDQHEKAAVEIRRQADAAHAEVCVAAVVRRVHAAHRAQHVGERVPSVAADLFGRDHRHRSRHLVDPLVVLRRRADRRRQQIIERSAVVGLSDGSEGQENESEGVSVHQTFLSAGTRFTHCSMTCMSSSQSNGFGTLAKAGMSRPRVKRE